MPSSPVLVPEVGRGRERPAVKILAACRQAARLAQKHGIETLVLLLPSETGELEVWVPQADGLRRSFDELDAPELVREDRVSGEVIDQLTDKYRVTLRRRAASHTPHSALASLYFLNGDAQRVIVPVGIPADEVSAAVGVGRDLAAVLRARGEPVCLVASGELSAKVFPGAPGGYHPAAAEFDARVVKMIATRDQAALLAVGDEERRAAGEHLLPQLLTLFSATETLAAAEVLQYEAPFGEGYVAAILSESSLSGRGADARC